MIKEIIYKKIKKITCKKLNCEEFWVNKPIDITNDPIDEPITKNVLFLKIMLSGIKIIMRSNAIINVLIK